MAERSSLRVLILNEFFYPDDQGGTSTAVTNIATRLRDQHGATVTVVASRFAYRDHSVTYSPHEVWNEIQIHRSSGPNWLRASTAKRFLGNLIFAANVSAKLLTLPKQDVTLVSTAPLTLPIAARLLRRLRGVPYAYLIYDLDPDRTVALKQQAPDSRPVKWLRAWQTQWLRGADQVVAIGRCMRDYLISHYHLKPERVSVAEVGANPDVIVPLSKETRFRKAQKLDGFVVLYSGNFGQYHDFETTLGAAEALRDTRPDVHFVLVGGGHRRKWVEAQVAERKLINVRLFDFVAESELADLLASADLHLVTLEPGMEGLCVPSKFYSCLASGRPVGALMSAETEVSMTVNQDHCGFRVDIGDSVGLANQIKYLAENPKELEAMGDRARATFERSYTIDITVDKIHEALVKAIKHS